jgi:DNA repair protein RAD16
LQSGIKCVQLVGSMSISARDAAIKRFTEDPDCKIFLMSLKAGGVALNLTIASHVSNSILSLVKFNI